jgi:glycosyltransferase involved in cell wall biosynthesis
MKINSDLTILICNYNHGKYIEKLLKSVEQQSVQPNKIIIIDDGSSDNSQKFLQKYSNSEKYKIIFNKKNEGVIFRMNQGLDLITTEYFMVYGADDIMLNKNSIKISLDALNRYPESGLSTGLICTLNDDYTIKRIVNSPIPSNVTTYFTAINFLKTFQKCGTFINGHLTIVRTKFFKNIIQQYPNIGQFTDICAFYSIAVNHGLIFIPEVLGYYRLQEDGYASKSFQNKFLTFKNLIRMLQIIKNKNFYNYDLSNFLNIYKLLSRIFYYKLIINKKINSYNSFNKFFSKIFLNFKIFLYFFCSSPTFFFTYHYYKIKFLFRKNFYDLQ